MSRKKSKLKAMAAAGDRWAIDTLARMQAQGRAAAKGAAKPRNPALGEAMRDAEEIRQWTDGPKPAPWRVYRLAQALSGERGQ